ncbi:MAG: response regulator [Actinomycetota bacterium]|nr:response regulator [Actinomycetota bacterium]
MPAETDYAYGVPIVVRDPRPEQPERRGTLRVLIVDDMPEIRFLFEVALSREPKIRLVGQAGNGREAVEKTEFLRPDLVVVDRQMPVMDGVEATRAIKERWPQVEVVAFTSSGHLQGHHEMRDAGATAAFDKSDLKPLLNLIRERAEARGAA